MKKKRITTKPSGFIDTAEEMQRRTRYIVDTYFRPKTSKPDIEHSYDSTDDDDVDNGECYDYDDYHGDDDDEEECEGDEEGEEDDDRVSSSHQGICPKCKRDAVFIVYRDGNVEVVCRKCGRFDYVKRESSNSCGCIMLFIAAFIFVVLIALFHR